MGNDSSKPQQKQQGGGGNNNVPQNHPQPQQASPQNNNNNFSPKENNNNNNNSQSPSNGNQSGSNGVQSFSTSAPLPAGSTTTHPITVTPPPVNNENNVNNTNNNTPPFTASENQNTNGQTGTGNNNNNNQDDSSNNLPPPGFNPHHRRTSTGGNGISGGRRGASAFKEQLQQTNQQYGLGGTTKDNNTTNFLSPGNTQTNLPNYEENSVTPGAGGNNNNQKQQQTSSQLAPPPHHNNHNNNPNDFSTNTNNNMTAIISNQNPHLNILNNNNNTNSTGAATSGMNYGLAGSIQFGAMLKNNNNFNANNNNNIHNNNNLSIDPTNMNNYSTVVGAGVAPQQNNNNNNNNQFGHHHGQHHLSPHGPPPTTTATIETMMLNLNNMNTNGNNTTNQYGQVVNNNNEVGKNQNPILNSNSTSNNNNHGAVAQQPMLVILDNKNLQQLGLINQQGAGSGETLSNIFIEGTDGVNKPAVSPTTTSGGGIKKVDEIIDPTTNKPSIPNLGENPNKKSSTSTSHVNLPGTTSTITAAGMAMMLNPQMLNIPNGSGQYLLSTNPQQGTSTIVPLQSQQSLLSVCQNNNNNPNAPKCIPTHTPQTAQQLREACSGLRMLLRNATRELSEDERRAIKELYDILPHDILTNNESKLQRERVADMWKEAFSNSRFQDTFSEEFDKLSNNMQGALFASTDIRQQARALSGMITQAMQVLNNPPSLQSLLRVLGAKHGMYGVDQKHFSFMGSALTRTLQTVLGDRFTPDLQQEWSRIYSMLAQAMVHAQKEHNSNTAMAAQFRRKALQLYLTNFSRHVSRLLATIRKRAPRSDILVLCEAWMNKSSPHQILNLRPLEYRNPYNIRDGGNFENSGTSCGRSSRRSTSSKTPKDDETTSPTSRNDNNNKRSGAKETELLRGAKQQAKATARSRTPQPSTAASNQYPSVTAPAGGGQALTIQNLTGIVAAAATAAAEPLARFLTDVIENSLRAVDVELLDQGAANSTPALLMWLRTAFGNISDKEIVRCLSQGFTTVMLHGTTANDPNVAWVDSHLQKGLLAGLHQLQTTIPFMPLVGPFAVMQIRIEEFRRLLKLNGKKMRFTVKEIDRLLTACLAACQCHRIQTEREDVEDVSNSVIIAAHVWQLVALSVMLNTTISNLPEMPPLNITGLNLRGHGPSFRRDLPRLCIAIHQSSAASPVPRYSPADPYRIVGVSMSELNSLSLGTAGGQCLMSPEAYRSLKLEKHLHREGKLTSPPLVGNNLKITLPQLDWSTFTIDTVSAVVRIHGGKDERPPLLHSITLKVHKDREFPRPMLYGSSMRIASRSDEDDDGNNEDIGLHDYGGHKGNDFYAMDD